MCDYYHGQCYDYAYDDDLDGGGHGDADDDDVFEYDDGCGDDDDDDEYHYHSLTVVQHNILSPLRFNNFLLAPTPCRLTVAIRYGMVKLSVLRMD